MTLHRSIGLIILVCCLALGCSVGKPCQEGRGVTVKSSSARALNRLLVDCIGDDGHTGVLSITYPSHRVFVSIGQRDSVHSSIKYERCYVHLESDIPRRVLEIQGPADHLLEIQETKQRIDGGWLGYAKRGDVVYRYDSPQKISRVLQCLDPLVAAVEDELYSTYTARAEMEQFINGSWTNLTRFKFAGSMAFWLAPQDTVKLRVRFAAFKVHYYSDRVIVDGHACSSSSNISFEVRRPVNGYWPTFSPSDQADPFFTEFQSAKVAIGEDLSFEYVLPPRSITSTLDVFTLKDGVRQPLKFVLGINGPDLATPRRSSSVSDWPLVPSEMKQDAESSDLGFPGGIVLPLWAVDKLFELGGRYAGTNPANKEVYGEYLKKRYNERDKEKQKKGSKKD